MPVSINSNYAATAASNNLALSNSMLQRSLNRLSSGSRIVSPADDAGGTAVAMRLSANAKRSGSAATNINNAVSLLQNQDGALKVGGKILERMAELQSLWNDATKNADDKALYDIEFHALQGQLQSLSEEKFNGVNIFGSTPTDIITSAAGDQTLRISAKPVGSAGEDGTPSTLTSGSAPSDPVAVTGHMVINGMNVDITSGDTLAEIAARISATPGLAVTASVVASKLVLTNDVNGTDSISIDSTDSTIKAALKLASGDSPVSVTGTDDSPGSVQLLIQAGSLGDLNVESSGLDLNTVINNAQDEFAQYRAHNGAEQNGLNFAAELLVLNKANLEAATGRIVDVDVAEESTQLAKWTTLTQAGTAMLAQANQANSLVLKLIGQ